MKRLRRFLITTVIGGVVVLLPIVILVLVIRLIFRFVDQAIDPLSQLVNLKLPDLVVDLIIIGAIVAFCFLVGLVVRTQFGKSALRYVEFEWLERIPVYSTIRDIIQQFTGAKKAPFKQVVAIDAFGTGLLMTGFVTDEQDGMYTVFVPTAPNPTNGFVFHATKDQVKFLSARSEEAMRTVVGMGVGSQQMLWRSAVRPEPPPEISHTSLNDQEE